MISLFSTRIRFGTPFWTLPGSLLGALWPPRWLKTRLKFVLDRPRAVQEYFFSVPRVKKRVPKRDPKINDFQAPKIGGANGRWTEPVGGDLGESIPKGIDVGLRRSLGELPGEP